MEEESPYVMNYNATNDVQQTNPQTDGGKIALEENLVLKYIVYGVLIFVIIMVLFNAYSTFCENRESGFLSSGVRDDPEVDDDYVEKQVKILKRLQKNNLE
jgi:hypothetical protein